MLQHNQFLVIETNKRDFMFTYLLLYAIEKRVNYIITTLHVLVIIVLIVLSNSKI